MLLAIPDKFSLGAAALTNGDFVITLAVCSQRYPLAVLAFSLIILLCPPQLSDASQIWEIRKYQFHRTPVTAEDLVFLVLRLVYVVTSSTFSFTEVQDYHCDHLNSNFFCPIHTHTHNLHPISTNCVFSLVFRVSFVSPVLLSPGILIPLFFFTIPNFEMAAFTLHSQ